MPLILGRKYDGDFGSYVEEVIFDFEPDESVEDEETGVTYSLYRGDLLSDLDEDLTDEETEFLEDHIDGGLIIETDEEGESAFLWFKDSDMLDEAWEERSEGSWDESGEEEEEEDEDDDAAFLGDEDEDSEPDEDENEEGDDDSEDEDDQDEEEDQPIKRRK